MGAGTAVTKLHSLCCLDDHMITGLDLQAPGIKIVGFSARLEVNIHHDNSGVLLGDVGRCIRCRNLTGQQLFVHGSPICRKCGAQRRAASIPRMWPAPTLKLQYSSARRSVSMALKISCSVRPRATAWQS